MAGKKKHVYFQLINQQYKSIPVDGKATEKKKGNENENNLIQAGVHITEEKDC